MKIGTLELHPGFPEKVWVVVEQPCTEVYRLAYDAAKNEFVRTEYKSLLYERGFRGAYGWIGGLGLPPGKHYDVFLLTKQKHQAGDILLGYICGIFFRHDGDHKLVALDEEWRSQIAQVDIAYGGEETRQELMNVYPHIGENEGWFGAQTALSYIEQLKTKNC